MGDFGKRPILKWLPVGKLEVDARYQRSLETARSARLIDRIVVNFRWAAFQAVSVVEKGARYVIIDGQHRVEAARRLKIASVPCILVEDLSLAEQAKLFVEANDRVALNQFAIFHAKVAAGDADACKVAAFCKQYGVVIPRSVTVLKNSRVGVSHALSMLMEIALDEDDVVGRAAIKMLAGLWPGEKGAFSKPLIMAARAAMRELPERWGAVADALRARPPLQWTADFPHRGGGWMALQRHIVAAAEGKLMIAGPRPRTDVEIEEIKQASPRGYYHPACPQVDPERRALLVGDNWNILTASEWTLFETLARHGGRAVSKDSLWEALYPAERDVDAADEKIVDVFICKMRQKCPFGIETVWGHGYILNGYKMASAARRVDAVAVPGVTMAQLMGSR